MSGIENSFKCELERSEGVCVVSEPGGQIDVKTISGACRHVNMLESGQD